MWEAYEDRLVRVLFSVSDEIHVVRVSVGERINFESGWNGGEWAIFLVLRGHGGGAW